MPTPLGLQTIRADVIAMWGSSVTLPDGTTAKARFKTSQTDLQRYVSTDSMGMGDRLPVIFEFDGTVQGSLTPSMDLVFDGVTYRIDTLHPDMQGDVCTLFAVACYQV